MKHKFNFPDQRAWEYLTIRIFKTLINKILQRKTCAKNGIFGTKNAQRRVNLGVNRTLLFRLPDHDVLSNVL